MRPSREGREGDFMESRAKVLEGDLRPAVQSYPSVETNDRTVVLMGGWAPSSETQAAPESERSKWGG